MKKVSDAYIARVAKQASDLFCLFAMVNMKNFCSTSIWISAGANRAFAVLFFQHTVIRSVRDTKTPFQMVVAFLLWIAFIPFTIVSGMRFRISLMAFTYFLHTTFFAVVLQAIVRSSVFVKFRAQLYLLTSWTMFVGRGIAFEFGHQLAPIALNQPRPKAGLMQ